MLPFPLLPILVIPPLLVIYILSTFILHLISRYRSSLRALPGPPSPSFFLGNLRELHDQEKTSLLAKWSSLYGPTFVYRGFVGGYRLITTDPVAVAHILGRAYDYPKPDFVRNSLATMAAGHHGLLVVEGEHHRRQRKIIAPAFSASHIRTLSPVFWQKATQLRQIWIDVISHPPPSDPSTRLHSRPSDPLLPPIASPLPQRGPARLRFANRVVSVIPNPFAAFVPSKAGPSSQGPLLTSTAISVSPPGPTLRPRGHREAGSRSPEEKLGNSFVEAKGAKVDVLPWLTRSTLDVIGQAGFGYSFNSVASAASTPSTVDGGIKHPEDELAAAYGVIFNTARQFRALTILEVWFPFLRRFRTNSTVEDEATATLRRIGLGLIEEKKREVLASRDQSPPSGDNTRHPKSTSAEDELDDRTKGRDLLTVLIKSNLSSDQSQRLSMEEILSQISTFVAAGHETAASGLTWTFYALASHPEHQTRLRTELRSIPLTQTLPHSPSESTIQAILSNKLLDDTLRECLRLHSPVSNTMRVAAQDDIIPLSPNNSFRDKNGRWRSEIVVRKGDIITIPISEINRCEDLWGERGREFWVGRWESGKDGVESDDGGCEDGVGSGKRAKGGVPGLWGGLMTFLNGNPVNGHRACIGYRFALNELKIFLFVLLRDLEFSIDPDVEIEKSVNVVTRPCVKSEPHAGNQMPLYVRLVPPETEVPSNSVS